ncbi:MAG TPA: hypothetical protein VIG08_04035 [Gemmatimonadales bacterium]|jgi:hypothetical protein
MTRLRLVLAMAGFAAALLAITTEDRRVGWAAIAILATAFLLRLLQRKPDDEHREDESDTP